MRNERPARSTELRQHLDNLTLPLSYSELGDKLPFFAAEVSSRDLHDPAGAVNRLNDLLRRYPHSTLRYRALQEIAWQSLRRHPSPTAEDRSQSCSALALLRQDPPDPAARAQAQKLSRELRCP